MLSLGSREWSYSSTCWCGLARIPRVSCGAGRGRCRWRMRLIGKQLKIHLRKISLRRRQGRFSFRNLFFFYGGRQFNRGLGRSSCFLHLGFGLRFGRSKLGRRQGFENFDGLRNGRFFGLGCRLWRSRLSQHTCPGFRSGLGCRRLDRFSGGSCGWCRGIIIGGIGNRRSRVGQFVGMRFIKSGSSIPCGSFLSWNGELVIL